MKNLKFIFLILFLSSCNLSEHKIEKVNSIIENAEQNIDGLTKEDIEDLDLKIEELKYELEMNRNKYTDEQVKEILKIQGRYAALIVKKEFNTFKETVNDLGNQIEGFIEGIKSDTINKTNENE